LRDEKGGRGRDVGLRLILLKRGHSGPEASRKKGEETGYEKRDFKKKLGNLEERRAGKCRCSAPSYLPSLRNPLEGGKHTVSQKK